MNSITCDSKKAPPHKKSKPSQDDISVSPLAAASWFLFPNTNDDNDDNHCDDHDAKRPFVPTFQIHDTVFWRSKSAKELGRRGIIVEGAASMHAPPPQPPRRQQPQRVMVRFPNKSRPTTTTTTTPTKDNESNNYFEKEISVKRLLPIFETAKPQQHQQKQQQSSIIIVVTADTTSYRLLASSQLTKDTDDVVLEIGCSTGEASAIMVQYCKSWIGFDTSEEMVERCNQRLSSSSVSSVSSSQKNDEDIMNKNNTNTNMAFQMDALVDPHRAQQLVRDCLVPSTNANKQSSSSFPNKIFIDIGGNRDCDAVWRMLEWATTLMTDTSSSSMMTATSSSPPCTQMIVVKSQELVAQLQNEAMTCWRRSDVERRQRHRI